MARIRLIHWDLAQVAARAALLRAAGHTVEYATDLQKSQATGLGDDPPDGVLIDLTRMPSQGRMTAKMLRQSRRTRGIPVVFAGGADDKVARVLAELPDAVCVAWEGLPEALAALLAGAPRKPMAPRVVLSTGAALAKKLGIRAGMQVALVDAPGHVIDLLGELPAGAAVHEDRAVGDLVLWFVHDAETLEEQVLARFGRAGSAVVWIAWRKGQQGPDALKVNQVHAVGRAAGRGAGNLCAIDAHWSAMQFGAAKKAARGEDDDDLGFDLEALRREDGRGG